MSTQLPSGAAVPSAGLPVLRVPAPSEAWIGLGSNLGQREENLRAALEAFGHHVVAVSRFYETAPWGIRDQPWFLNAVACLEWVGTARELLDRCLSTELEMGRVRGEKNGPRLIDLDVLMVGDQQVEEPGFRLPHRGFSSRRSVLEPWAELAPDLLVPGQCRSLSDLKGDLVSLEGQQVSLWRGPSDSLGPLRPRTRSADRLLGQAPQLSEAVEETDTALEGVQA